MSETFYDDNTRLLIETGVSGGEQESDWANGTLQGVYETREFTIHTYLAVPEDILEAGDRETATYIYNVLGLIEIDGLRFEVRVGPGGGVEKEDEEEDE